MIDLFFSNQERMKQIAHNNHVYAINKFLASKVVRRIEVVYERVVYSIEVDNA